MWVTSTIGFFSVVQKTGDDNLTVRTRARGDLERLRETYLPELGEIVEGAGTDYRYRAKCIHQQWAEAMRLMSLNLDYSNFKSTVSERMGHERAHLYHAVWSALWKIKDDKYPKTHGPKDGELGKDSSAFEREARRRGMRLSCGGVIFDERGRVLLRRVRNDFGGVRWTFGKGRPDDEESPEETALREVFEETGMPAEIVAPIRGAFEGTTTLNHYWLMRQVGDPVEPCSETAEVRWCTIEEARNLIRESPSRTVQRRDFAVLDAALEVAAQQEE